MPFREIILVIHLLGLGIFVAVLVSGSLIESQFRKTSDLQTKALLLRVTRSIGLLSPFAVLIMLLTGIANMYMLGIGLFDFGWLTAKIIFFAIAATNGIVSGVRGNKRSTLIHQMAGGEAAADADAKLKEYNKQTSLSYFVNAVLFVIIVSLSVYGRMGGQ